MTTRTEIICSECDSTFLYTDAERAFRESRGLDRPTRCPECRARERSIRNDDLISLYNKSESFEPFLFGMETQNGGGNGYYDPTGTWLYALNQKGDSIVQFAIDQQTGELTPTGNVAEVPTPVSLVFTTGG